MKKILLLTLLIPTLTFADITKDLKFGMKDAQVKELQQFLIDKGYIPKGSKTGYFGAKTLQGVQRYQKASKLPATGFVGRLTRVSISKENKISEIATFVPENIVATSTATTSEPISTSTPTNTPTPVVPTPEKVYNIIIMEETTKPYTFGTPTLVTKKTPDGDQYQYIELPVIFDSSVVSQGDVVNIEGSVEYTGTVTAGIGNEFNFSKSYKLDNIMPLYNITGGTYSPTITIKNSAGTVKYESSEVINLNQ